MEKMQEMVLRKQSFLLQVADALYQPPRLWLRKCYLLWIKPNSIQFIVEEAIEAGIGDRHW